jgi:hypothetical protein
LRVEPTRVAEGAAGDLGLDGVEVGEAIEGLEGLVLKRLLGERTELEERRVRRVFLGEDEVAQVDSLAVLCVQPAVGNGTNDILALQRLEERDGEGEHVRLCHLI